MNRRILPELSSLALVAVAAFCATPAFAQGEAPPATPAGADAPKADAPKPDAPKSDAEKKEAEPKKADDDESKKKKATGGDTASPSPGAAGSSTVGESGVSLDLGSGTPRKDEAKVDTKKSDDAEGNRNPFAGSILFWDHSTSTQTARLEPSAQQSYTPSYEWWFSFQPRYAFNKRLSYNLRADLYKEMTNANETALYRENVLGDVWNTVRYEMPISERLKDTKISFSGTIKLPLSKESQAKGTYFKPGAGVGLSQKIPLKGESAKWFPGASAGLSVGYEHPITRSTTPTDLGGFETLRQDAGGRTVSTDQLSGSMMPNHTVLAVARGKVSITDKWDAGLSLIFINNWLYAPTSGATVRTATGTVEVPRNSDAATFTQSSWVILSSDYDLMDELGVGIGYYNLAGIIAPDGQRRGIVGSDNIWWSPSARVFATVTANLDKIYERAAGIKKPEEKKTATGPSAAAQ
ncbi:MAG: hypothetical protein IPG50_00390 [Myxococcales bacterium]|nr:hypothetical protein [Myxococcales bacterium]